MIDDPSASLFLALPHLIARLLTALPQLAVQTPTAPYSAAETIFHFFLLFVHTSAKTYRCFSLYNLNSISMTMSIYKTLKIAFSSVLKQQQKKRKIIYHSSKMPRRISELHNGPEQG